MAKGNPAVSLSRSHNATELHIPSISNTVTKLTFTDTADTQALAASMVAGRLTRVSASEDCYIRWDSSAVAATVTDTLFIRGVEPQRVPEAATHFSAIRVSTNGVLTVTEFI